MPLTLDSIDEGGTDYPAVIEANFAAIQAFVNSLAAAISAAVGDGAQLVMDAFDRPGIVGETSYRLGLEEYDGTAIMLCGRRPAYDVVKGDQDLNVAYVRYGGDLHRVFVAGDTEMNAGAIVSGLPKTIYVGIDSSGTPQFYEDTSSTEVLYVYAIDWDGVELDVDSIVRMAEILPGFPTIQALHNAVKVRQAYDGDTDWLAHDESKSALVFAGDPTDNDVDLRDVMEVTHGFIDMPDAGGFYAVGADNKVELELWDDTDTRCNEEDILLDCSMAPDTVFFKIDKTAMGRERFITKYKRFRLVKVAVGGGVESAAGFTWGLYCKPVLGNSVPKDDTRIGGL